MLAIVSITHNSRYKKQKIKIKNNADNAGLECERVVRASLCESELCLPRSLLRLRRAMLRASVPRFAACRRCVRCAAVVCCRAVPPRCCERVLRCARVMYTIVRMIGWWFSSVGARCWQRAGSHSFDAMDYRQRARRGCSDRRGLRSKTRRGTLRVQRKTRRSRWLKVSAGLLVLTARLFILTVPSAPARV